jgi:hypothetical protein
VSYIARPAGTAVVRSATIEDKVAVARLAARENSDGPAADQRQRQDRVLDMLSSLRDRRTVVHVVELDHRLCAAVSLRIASQWRIFASTPLVSEAGRAFDEALGLRLIEHAVQCCQADGWRALRYLADLEAPAAVRDHFDDLGYDCTAEAAQLGLSDWLLYGRRSQELRFRFRHEKGGSDESDPRIVWF